MVFSLSQDIGKNVSVQTIDQNYDAAVFWLRIENSPRSQAQKEERAGAFHFAVDYLSQATRAWLKQEEVKEETMNAKGKKVVVIGGGDTGNDCVATCIRQGCTSVVQLEMMPQPPAGTAVVKSMAAVAASLQDGLRAAGSHCGVPKRSPSVSDNSETFSRG